MGTHWLGEDFLRLVPERVHGQRPPYPPDFQVGILFGGILFRDRPKIGELPTAEEYAALMRRLEVADD